MPSSQSPARQNNMDAMPVALRIWRAGRLVSRRNRNHFFQIGVDMARTGKTAGGHGKLLDALSRVDRPGEVCTWGDRPLTMPGLEVSGLGAVRLPLGTAQARKLMKLCHQAPYGKGTETVVDTNVRRVWELDPDQFQLTNPKWDDLVASILQDVQRALGLEDRKLAAHLYKLLVYEKGSFFLPHRDGEKLDRMVATLVIALPAKYEGGELVVSHDGRQHEILFTGAASGHELSYAAFYADCQHEVRPVRSGFRLCLTYNVTLAEKRGKQGLAAPSYGAAAAAIGGLLAQWRDEPDVQKLAVTLDHRYTQDGLSMDNLKGLDRARAEVLFEAAEQADCVAHLALVTLWQSGSAEGGYDDYSFGRGRGYRWSDYDDDDEDEDYEEEDYDETGTGYEMGEVYDWSLSADHWSDRQGHNVRLGEIRLDEGEIVADEGLDEGDPHREDFEGYTGNAGMTLERWYHRAAVVIWPRSKHFHVLCSAGTDASIGGLEPLVNRLKRATKAKRKELHRECLAFASAILDSWQTGHRGYPWDKSDRVDRNVFPELLCQLGDVELVRRFLAKVMPADDTVQLGKSFAKFCQQHGWTSFEAELTTVIETMTAATVIRNAELLQSLCVARDKNAERIELCRRLSERSVKALAAFEQQPRESDWQWQRIDRAALLSSLVKAMTAIGAEQPLSQLLEFALACDQYDLTDAHLAAIFALESRLVKLPGGDTAVSRWLAACRRELENRTAEAPQEPTDYRRADKLSCKCQDCRALRAFLADPNRREARFPMAKERRRHLHSIIGSNRCDCTHVTERRGRPYTLVCTKTSASYEAACKIYERDLRNLSRIVALERKMSNGTCSSADSVRS
ncbi:MAG: 2OG-Fe(II) oxygenase [Planctomycetaceae bacterium]|nr:MAG: 2OG-Fe(II) oxygenase [Planctomycetaceae bacterium]